MRQVSGVFIINGKECFGAAQAETKQRIVEIIQQVADEFTDAWMATYWSNQWTAYANHSIDDADTEGVWATDGKGVKKAKVYRRIL